MPCLALRHITQLCCVTSHNREAIDKVVEDLLEKETLSGDDFRATLSK
jgi:ATP-dependent Zn protease